VLASALVVAVRRIGGDALEKSMSHDLIETPRSKPDAQGAPCSEVFSAHPCKGVAAIDLLDRSTGSVRHTAGGGVFTPGSADAWTGWLPESIARDDRSHACTGDAMASRGAGCVPSGRRRARHSRAATRSRAFKRVAAAVREGRTSTAFVH
jgi:hypothetical protein